MDIKLRPGAVSDCEVCEQLSRIGEFDNPDADYPPADFFKAHIDDDEMFLVAEFNGKVVGYIVGQPMKGDWVYLSLLVVNPEMRGQGIGRMLIDAILKRSVAMGFGYVTLFAPEYNKKTLGFYRSLGFVEGKAHVQFGMIPMM